MATLLDIGLLKYFSIIFPFLLVFTATFAMLKKTKFLGESNAIVALISFSTAFIVLMSGSVLEVIRVSTPWFVFLSGFILLLFLTFGMFGVKEDLFLSTIRENKSITWTIIIISLVIVLGSTSFVFGQRALETRAARTATTVGEDGVPVTVTTATTTPSFGQNVFNTLFNPKILGMVFILLVSVFTIAMITTESVK